MVSAAFPWGYNKLSTDVPMRISALRARDGGDSEEGRLFGIHFVRFLP
jgi:hypothetical protein